MAHLDAEKLVTVEKNKAELAENVVIPDKGAVTYTSVVMILVLFGNIFQKIISYITL